MLLLTSTAPAAGLSKREASLTYAVNQLRRAHDLRPLAVDARLVQAARGHSARMLRRDVLTHAGFADRVSRSGAPGPHFGENLAWATGLDASATAIVHAWLASPAHRANLLRPGFRRLGIGTRKGRFAGRPDATVVTANFAGS